MAVAAANAEAVGAVATAETVALADAVGLEIRSISGVA